MAFEHDRLEAYRIAREANAAVQAVARRIPRGRPEGERLHRASLAVPLRVARGAAERRPARRAHDYRSARRAAAACAAILDACVDTGLLSEALVAAPRHDLERVSAALARARIAIERRDTPIPEGNAAPRRGGAARPAAWIGGRSGPALPVDRAVDVAPADRTGDRHHP